MIKPPKKVQPQGRGEKWELWDGRTATVIRKLSKDIVEVVNERGYLESIGRAGFKRRIYPAIEAKEEER